MIFNCTQKLLDHIARAREVENEILLGENSVVISSDVVEESSVESIEKNRCRW